MWKTFQVVWGHGAHHGSNCWATCSHKDLTSIGTLHQQIPQLNPFPPIVIPYIIQDEQEFLAFQIIFKAHLQLLFIQIFTIITSY